MKEKQIQMKTSYKAMSPLLSEDFKGEVVAKFINTVVLQITEHKEKDSVKVNELNYRIAVKYDDLTKLSN